MNTVLLLTFIWFIGFAYFMIVMALDKDQPPFLGQIIETIIVAAWPITLPYAIISGEKKIGLLNYLFVMALLGAIVYVIIK